MRFGALENASIAEAAIGNMAAVIRAIQSLAIPAIRRAEVAEDPVARLANLRHRRKRRKIAGDARRAGATPIHEAGWRSDARYVRSVRSLV